MKSPSNIRALALVAALHSATLVWSCDNSAQINGTGSGKAGELAPVGAAVGKEKDSGSAGHGTGVQLGSSVDANVAGDHEAGGGAGTLGGVVVADKAAPADNGASIGDKSAATPAAEPLIDYPALDFAGTGATSCKGKYYTTTAQFATTLSAAELDLNLFNAHISVDSDKASSKANDQIQKSIGNTKYTRVSAAQRQTLKAAGFNYADYAIFASQLTKEKTGQTFTFDAPLPVFPWPAPAARYADLSSGPKTWTANVTGAFTSPVTVEIAMVSTTAETQVVTITTTIVNDQGGGYYSIFPLPHVATFTVNSTTLDVRQIDAESIFQNTDNCSGGRETVKMVYKLCTKKSHAQNQTYPCQ